MQTPAKDFEYEQRYGNCKDAVAEAFETPFAQGKALPCRVE